MKAIDPNSFCYSEANDYEKRAWLRGWADREYLYPVHGIDAARPHIFPEGEDVAYAAGWNARARTDA